MIKLKINGQEVEVEQGTTVLQAAKKIGVDIPHFCYHPALEKVGSCRMCQVEFKAPGRPSLGVSCRTDVVEGMEVETHSEAAVKARAGVLAFLLANHPLDCPICDKAGECPLQDYTFEHADATSYYDEAKRKNLKKTPLGGHIIYDAERCILCTRCSRFMEDYAKAPQLLVRGRGDHTTIDIFPGRPLDSEYTGNLADICPVGALTLEEFRFKVRSWFLEALPSICPYCSRGCNIDLDVRKSKNRLYRVRPRVNSEVNGHFICNEGRFRPLEAFAGTPRLSECRVDTKTASQEAALEKTAEAMQKRQGGLLVVASARRTVEELYAISKVFGPLDQVTLLAAAPDASEADGILRTGEQAPNLKALELLGFSILPLESLAAKMAEPEMDVLVMLDGSIHLDEQTRQSFSFILYSDYVATDLADQADTVIPGRAWFEKEGSFINFENRVQQIHPALKPPDPGIVDDLQILAELHQLIHDMPLPGTAAELFDRLAGENTFFAGMTYLTVPDEGVVSKNAGGSNPGESKGGE